MSLPTHQSSALRRSLAILRAAFPDDDCLVQCLQTRLDGRECCSAPVNRQAPPQVTAAPAEVKRAVRQAAPGTRRK